MPAPPEPESSRRPEFQGSPRSFALLYAPHAQRELLSTLFALEHEILGAARPGLDHSVAHLRLQWWQEEAERAAIGEALHPLVRTAHAQLAACGVPGPDLTGLVQVTRWDLAVAPLATRSHLDAYCAHWAASITTPVARCALPSEQPLALAFGGRLGTALRELELLENPTTEEHSRLRAELAACVALLGARHQPPLRGLLVWAALASRHSMRTRRSDARRFTDAWQGWRAARRAEAGRLVLNSGSAH